MKYVITALLSVAIIWTSHVQAAPINNSTVRVKTQAVQVATPEKVAEVTQTPTEQQPVVNSETSPELEAKAFIYFKESSNNPTAQNAGGCYGLGQDCNGIVKDKCGASYECQNTFFTEYMLRRYGSWQAAKAFWLSARLIDGRYVGNWW